MQQLVCWIPSGDSSDFLVVFYQEISHFVYSHLFGSIYAKVLVAMRPEFHCREAGVGEKCCHGFSSGEETQWPTHAVGADTGVQILPLDSWADSWRGCTSVLTRRAEIGSNYAVGIFLSRVRTDCIGWSQTLLGSVSDGCIDGKGSDSGRNNFSRARTISHPFLWMSK